MNYIVKNCPALYSGAEKWKLGFGENEHICKDGIRYCKNRNDCLLKRIVELTKVIDTPCDNCDGVGYYDGCKDDDCSFYRLMKIQSLLEIEEAE